MERSALSEKELRSHLCCHMDKNGKIGSKEWIDVTVVIHLQKHRYDENVIHIYNMHGKLSYLAVVMGRIDKGDQLRHWLGDINNLTADKSKEKGVDVLIGREVTLLSCEERGGWESLPSLLLLVILSKFLQNQTKSRSVWRGKLEKAERESFLSSLRSRVSTAESPQLEIVFQCEPPSDLEMGSRKAI